MTNTNYRRNAGAFKVRVSSFNKEKLSIKRLKLLFFANVFFGTLLLLSCIISPYETYSDFQYGIHGVVCFVKGKPLLPCVCKRLNTYRSF